MSDLMDDDLTREARKQMSATTTPRLEQLIEYHSGLLVGAEDWAIEQVSEETLKLEHELTAKTAELEEAKETIRSVTQSAHDHAVNYRKANVRIAELQKELRETRAAALEEAAEIVLNARMGIKNANGQMIDNYLGSVAKQVSAKAASVREGKG